MKIKTTYTLDEAQIRTIIADYFASQSIMIEKESDIKFDIADSDSGDYPYGGYTPAHIRGVSVTV